MTYRDVPNRRRLKVQELAHPCPAAAERTKTKQPRSRLERWQILRELLVDRWSNPGHDADVVAERHLSVLGPLEAALIRRMFLNVERIFTIDDTMTVELDGHHISYGDDAAGVETSVYVTVTVTHDSGEIEHLRLKTGRHPTSEDEAAVLWHSAEEGETFGDIMAWPGEVEPIDPPSDIERRLAELIEAAPGPDRAGVRPGHRCVWCDRSALCGAYPSERRVPTTAPTLNLTKTDVGQLAECQRRVDWRRVHGIPRDDGDDVDVTGSVSQGRLFHDLVVATHGADRPDEAAAVFFDGAPPSEVADLRMMWVHHRDLLESESLDVRASEFPVGVTLVEGERASTRAVTLIAFVDLTARDANGGSVAVELKTGAPGDTGVEDDLYAVGMQRWLGPGPVTIHRHYVRSSPPVCEIVVVDPDDVEAARRRLERTSAVVHTWDWEDPLQPAWTGGSWCGVCEYRGTCESFR